jgi:hypothetical protein
MISGLSARSRLLRSLVWTTIGLAAAARADAQGLAGRVALEAIASASTEARALDDPSLIFDLVGTVRLTDGLDLVVRPWSMRRPGGDWMFEMYQLQLRYVSTTRLPFRVDAGILPSPVGLFTLELQAHRNPLVTAPFYYFVPLPPVDGSRERMRLITGGYPLGAMFSVSGARWDARAGVTDSTPAHPRKLFSQSRPPAHAQLVVGGGVTPITGMRIGAGFTRGRYRPRTAPGDAPTIDAQTASVFNLEGEYAIGHTRVAGEWVRDGFDTPVGDVVARGFNVQVAQTLTPRIFAAARGSRISSPISTIPVEVRRSFTAFEAGLGYRLTTGLTVRGGYQRQRAYTDTRWHDAAVMSLVWAERWW